MSFKALTYSFIKWLILWLILYFLIAVNDKHNNPFLFTTFEWFTAFISIKTNYFILNYYFKNRFYLKYILVIIFLNLTIGLLSFFTFYNFLPDAPNVIVGRLLDPFFWLLIYLGIKFYFLGLTGYYYNLDLKLKSLELRLALLKKQLHPHFLFNTLNTIYATSLFDPTKSKEMIVQLEYILTYFDNINREELITIDKEIVFLKSYMEFERKRLLEENNLITSIDIANTDCLIHRGFLIPIIENAFKYGIQNGIGVVNISIKSQISHLELKVTNQIYKSSKLKSSKTGLTNLKKRLSIVYKNDYLLSINKNKKEFSVLLFIPLQNINTHEN